MRVMITGLVLTLLCVAAVLYYSESRQASAIPAGPARTTSCMVWRATKGKTTVWLCGSIHLLRAADYPLPKPYETAFDKAHIVVMETAPGEIESPATKQWMATEGTLPAGQSLENTITPAVWQQLEQWCRTAGFDIASLQKMPPWRAAVTVGVMSYQRLGYEVARGMERYFSQKLVHRGKRSAGLESVRDQFAVFANLDASTQEGILRKALDETRDAPRRAAQLAAAWHEGDVTTAAQLIGEAFADFPVLRQRALESRNAAWLPKIEEYLAGTDEVMVLVGTGHLAGPGSLVDLLQQRGVTVEQQQYVTHRAR